MADLYNCVTLIFSLNAFSFPYFNLRFGSTAFVMGPQKQLRMMFDPVRLYATAIYVGCVVLALIFALGVCDI
jgi:hypothetical protein